MEGPAVAAARLFAAPRVTAESAADGSVLLRSAEPLGDYPATVIHSLRAWAGIEPDHLLVAERAPGGGWHRCGYGAAVAAAERSSSVWSAGWARAARCSCCPVTAWTTTW